MLTVASFVPEGQTLPDENMGGTVKLVGQNDDSVSLVPIRYEFPNAKDRWDADWIVFDGRVLSAEGNWEFEDSSLLASECPEIARWLRQAARGEIRPTDPDDNPSLTFIEPSLAFSVASYDDGRVGLRVHLTHLAAPPWQEPDEKLNTWAYFVELPMDGLDLVAAAEAWTRDIESFPPRGQK